ncbi:MAG: MBOAT family O-acyltransferase [Clostridiales bacterium]
MVFSSLLFLFYFLPPVLIIYYLSPKRFRNFILFIASLIFYAWGEPIYILIMFFSTMVDYIHGILVNKYLLRQEKKKARYAVISSVIINLTILAFFKYSDFLIANLNALLSLEIPLLMLPLPIGISFYTFQTMSYTIDIYRGDAKLQTNIIDFGAYVALFPQLIAGPIVRYKTVAEQFANRKENYDDFAYGIKRFLLGLGKKVLLANNIGLLWTAVSSQDPQTLPVLTAWLGIIAFSFQIYFDFSGYSDMAIGLGKMFGFSFLENFNYPYISRSITEFWRRWHISLGTWFKEYVYIPLGGNKKGPLKQIRNIFIVWFLTGFWHGASWNFLIWGIYFGLILMAEKLFLLKLLEKCPNFFRHFYTMFLVIISWAIFAHDSFSQGLNLLSALFGIYGNPLWDNQSLYLLYNNLILLLILVFASTSLPKKLWHNLQSKWQKIPALLSGGEYIYLLLIFLISIAFLVDASYNPFLYFRF